MMKIRAKLYGIGEVIIIDFVSALSHDIKAVYVDRRGKVGSGYIDTMEIEILDKDYIPQLKLRNDWKEIK